MSTRPLKVRETLQVKFLGLLKAIWKREYEVPQEPPKEDSTETPQKASRR